MYCVRLSIFLLIVWSVVPKGDKERFGLMQWNETTLKETRQLFPPETSFILILETLTIFCNVKPWVDFTPL